MDVWGEGQAFKTWGQTGVSPDLQAGLTAHDVPKTTLDIAAGIRTGSQWVSTEMGTFGRVGKPAGDDMKAGMAGSAPPLPPPLRILATREWTQGLLDCEVVSQLVFRSQWMTGTYGATSKVLDLLDETAMGCSRTSGWKAQAARMLTSPATQETVQCG